MQERFSPEQRSDYEASTWLRLGGNERVKGDPETLAQFRAAYACLTTLSTHLTFDVGPWFTVTPEDIKAEYEHFLAWSGADTAILPETAVGKTGVWFSLRHLRALSYRRLRALQEVGGEERKDYTIFAHFHQQIVRAAADEAEIERLIAQSQQRFAATTEKRPSMPAHLREKLTVAAAIDFPTATNILVSFPEEWDLIGTLRREDLPLYAAGFTPSEERGQDNHFHGLSAEVNRSLTKYRKYQLFEPWPTPILPVSWDVEAGEGRVERGGRLDLQLQPVAEAQAWTSEHYGVLWECYYFEGRRGAKWQEELAAFWRAVEQDMGVRRILTQPQDPAFEEGYTDFLRTLGYKRDTDFPLWWSKVVQQAE